MKSSIRSKLFLLVYGLILAFIAGLILLNNTFLENYYIRNREASLIEAFHVVINTEIDDADFSYEMQNVEKDYNLNIQVVVQTADFEPNFVWDDLNTYPDVFDRIYGTRFNISDGIISRIIYDFNEDTLADQDTYATQVEINSEAGYEAYLVDLQSEYTINNPNTQVIGLCVEKTQDSGQNAYYLLTISFQSITDNIKIFNSFTILVGFIFMVISFATMFFISYRFTNPILQINKIAEEIANLNFSNKVNITSDDEFGDLGESINRMSNQLEANILELQKTNDRLAKEILLKTDIDKMRREFIASASHELKTPLSLIMGYTEALKLSNLDAQTSEEYIAIILDETNKMNKLVMDLLKLSQMESKATELEFKDFDLQQFVDDTVNMFGLIFKEKEITLKTNLIDKTINSDYNQLQSVLTNFINNAINHVDEHKLIHIRIRELDNDSVRVSVYNSGTQIPEDEMDHIWDSFYKVDKARTRSYGGQGLGLSICRTILDLLGYDYGVINLDDGVEFYFDIFKI